MKEKINNNIKQEIPKEEKKRLKKNGGKKNLNKFLLFGVGLLSIGGLSYLGYKYFNKKYNFYKEQNIDIRLLPKPFFKAICNYEKIYRYDERLKAAYDEYKKGNDISVDIAGFLAFSTLETFLKHLITLLKPELLKNNQTGIVSLCKSLRSIGKITREDYEKIKSLVIDIRNNLIHGSLYSKDKVLDSILFIKEFINKNILLYYDYFKEMQV